MQTEATWPISYGFEHVAIKQKKNRCQSRLDADTTSEIVKGITRPIPLIASNMSTVCNSDFCIKLYQLGALGVMHRAAPNDHILGEVAKIAEQCSLVAASIGVGEDQYRLANHLVEAGCNILFIDIAHGYSDTVIDLGRRLKKDFPHVKVVVGNTVCLDMIEEVADFADALKVGIAQGLSCETASTAGCTEKQFSAVLKFKEASRRFGVPIISDGGLRTPDNFVKAIAAGASSCMAGSIFARCPESAAEQIYHNRHYVKVFAGMASRYVQTRWKGGLKDGTCPEGGVRYLEPGESVDKLLERWQGALRTGISYGGGTDVKSFQDAAEFLLLAR